MNCRRTNANISRSVFNVTGSCMAMAVCLAFAARGIAQEPATDKSVELQPDPSQGDFSNEFIKGSGQILPRTETSQNSIVVDGEAARQLQSQLKEREEQMRRLTEQYKKMESDFRRAAAQYNHNLLQERQPGSLDAERELLLNQVRELQAQMAAQAERQRQTPAPLPENAEVRVFALRYSKAPELTQVLANIVGDRGLRMAVDERSNSLIVTADENTMRIVEALLMRLDESGPDRKLESASLDTLQLRIVWLLDGVGGMTPNEGQASPQVLDALRRLGFEDPSVVCQQMTTLTLDDKNRGRFGFTVPVLVNSQLFELSGNGSVTPSGTNRFALQFEFEVQQQQNPQKTRLGGSILTPLAHYTVMGTTTFVESSLESPHPGVEPKVKPVRQHLSAFVVYLDRAPEFPAEQPAAEAPKAR